MNCMNRNAVLSLEVLAAISLSFYWTSNGLDVNIKTPSDCDKAFNISENGEVNINFAGSVFTRETDKCRIEVKHHETRKYPQMCLRPVTLDPGDCWVEVDVHNGFVIGDGYEDKKYSCRSISNEDECTYYDSQTIEFKNVLDNDTSDEQMDIQLKVYSKRSAYASSDDSDTGGLELRYILMIVGGAASLLSCICGLMYKCLKYNAASRQEETAGYPSVQYQNTTQQDAGYQPSAGFQQNGFEPTNYGNADSHSKASDMPDSNFSSPPPSYQQALDMKENAQT